MPGDPLFDTLFRPTASVPQVASAAPVRSAGTRSRAGNAMGRTRAALLDGARRAVEISGTKITMAQVAAAAGVAKATLYNHFRTREAVLRALLDEEIASLIEQSAKPDLQDALAAAASHISGHPLVRALARQEPATLAALASVDTEAPGWRRADDAVRATLSAAQRGGARRCFAGCRPTCSRQLGATASVRTPRSWWLDFHPRAQPVRTRRPIPSATTTAGRHSPPELAYPDSGA